MDRANNTSDIVSAGERPRGNSASTVDTTTLQQRNRVLEQEIVELNRAFERSQQNLQSVLAQLDLVEERERKQLAMELHDYLTQLLVLGHMKVGEVRRLTLPPKGNELVVGVESVLHEALKYCRTLMAELSPPMLKEEGLAAGIRSLSTQMKRYGLEVTVETDPVDDTYVSESSSAVLIRSVRELLINTVKHAASKQATVRMTCNHDLLQIVVRDEGGSDLAASTSGTDSHLSSGLGILFIRERMKALNGRLEFESVANHRTIATLIVPMRSL